MPEISPEDIFALHPKIRWVGLTTHQGQVVLAKMRPGVERATPENHDQRFLELGALILGGVAEGDAAFAGRVKWIAVDYEKYTELMVERDGKYLVLTFEPDKNLQTLREIITALETWK